MITLAYHFQINRRITDCHIFCAGAFGVIEWSVQPLPNKGIRVSWPSQTISQVKHVRLCAHCLNLKRCGSAPALRQLIYIKKLPCRDQVSLAVGVVPIEGKRMSTYTQLGRTSLCPDKGLNLVDTDAPFPCFMLPL